LINDGNNKGWSRWGLAPNPAPFECKLKPANSVTLQSVSSNLPGPATQTLYHYNGKYAQGKTLTNTISSGRAVKGFVETISYG
jgi:hypothetical protein